MIDPVRFAEIRRLPTGKEPHHLYLTPDEKSLLLALTGERFVEVYDVSRAPATLVKRIATGEGAHAFRSAGFLGDELPSERDPNDCLLAHALRSGDILLAHLGIWSRRDPWAPAVLEPLIAGLKAKGLCFRTLRDHPQYGPLFQR